LYLLNSTQTIMHVLLECRRNVILLTQFHDLHSQYPLPNYFPFSATTFIYILCWSESSIFTRYFSYNHAFLRPVYCYYSYDGLIYFAYLYFVMLLLSPFLYGDFTTEILSQSCKTPVHNEWLQIELCGWLMWDVQPFQFYLLFNHNLMSFVFWAKVLYMLCQCRWLRLFLL